MQNQKTPMRYGDGFDVGDFLVSSWGYDQTNVDFYLIKKRTAKTVTIVEVKSELLYGEPGSSPMSGRARVKEPVEECGEPMVRKRHTTAPFGTPDGGRIRIKSFASAWPTKPDKLHYVSWYA